MANNLQELLNELTTFIAMAEAADNQYFHIETWQLKSVLVGKFLCPNSALDTTAEDVMFDDTGDLSNEQIVARLMLDGDMPTRESKVVE